MVTTGSFTSASKGGATFQGTGSCHWNKFTRLEAYGQFGKLTGDIYVIPQIQFPVLWTAKENQFYYITFLVANDPDSFLHLKFSLKQILLSLSSLCEIHVNFLLNLLWRRLITSTLPLSQPCFAKTCPVWKKPSLIPDLHPAGESCKGQS